MNPGEPYMQEPLMGGKRAGIIFAILCLVLAILLLMNMLPPLTVGMVFAAALVALGTVSNGFRRR